MHRVPLWLGQLKRFSHPLATQAVSERPLRESRLARIEHNFHVFGAFCSQVDICGCHFHEVVHFGTHFDVFGHHVYEFCVI